MKTEKIKIRDAVHLKYVYGRQQILYWALTITIHIHLRKSPCHITRPEQMSDNIYLA